MNYAKPQVEVLGQAVCVIESNGNKDGNSFDGSGVPPRMNPAYDLDE
jgi:hypothetical protein